MAKWIIFRVGDDKGSNFHHNNAFGGLTEILTEHWDYSGKDAPSVGYRPSISKTEETETNGWPDTYSAPGDWVVKRVETYIADSSAEYNEIVVCYCDYEPIPEGDRTWKYIPVAEVTALNFGDGTEAEEAFEKWKAENPEKVKGTRASVK